MDSNYSNTNGKDNLLPVSSFFEKYRDKRVQATLTQMIGDEDADVGDFDSKPCWKRPKLTKFAATQDDESESEEEAEVVESTIVVSHQKKFQSEDKDYRFDPSKAQPGDLVMATALDIGHPALEYDHIGPSYVYFGVVKYFTYTKWQGSGEDDSWEGYLKDHERLKITWMTIQRSERRYIDSSGGIVKDAMPGTDFWVDIPPVHKNIVKLIAKRNSSDLSMVNGFLRKAIHEHFYFVSLSGWMQL